LTRRRRLSAAEWDELRRLVFARDGYICIARRMDPRAGPCRGKWGMVLARQDRLNPRDLTFEHVQDDYGSMGLKADDDEQHGVAACWGHALGAGGKGGFTWATANKDLERQYLRSIYGKGEQTS
jgi:hypothetical protein